MANGANMDVLNFDATGNSALDCIQIDEGFVPPMTWLKDASAVYNGDCDNLSVEDFSELLISVYPNPVKDLLVIEMPNKLDKVEIYNLLGQIVKTAHSKSLDLSSFSKGMYLVKVYAGNKQNTFKVLKE